MHQYLWSGGPVTLFGHSFGPFHIYAFAVCLTLGLGVSIFLFARDAGKYIAPKVGLNYEQGLQKALDLGIWVILCSLVGARLFYVLENHVEYTGKWLDAFKVWQGGIVFYGGLFGAVAVTIFWFRLEKWPPAFSFDLVAPYILLGHAFGRVGCYLNGCCFGIVDQAHGLIFPAAADNLPHLPTQLWELAGDLTLFFILILARKWTIRYAWLTASLYGLTYGLLRYIIEFWRREAGSQFLVFFNSVSQAISVALIVVSLITIIWIYLRRRKTGASGPSPLK
jgi:phosphatidylglycerol---prolipoprotein diacylglyceryl transferase